MHKAALHASSDVCKREGEASISATLCIDHVLNPYGSGAIAVQFIYLKSMLYIFNVMLVVLVMLLRSLLVLPKNVLRNQQ